MESGEVDQEGHNGTEQIKSLDTGPPGHGQYEVPQMVTVRYQVKKGSQQRRKAPITTPSVTKALCSFLHIALRIDRLS